MAIHLYDGLVAATLPLAGTEQVLIGNKAGTVDDIAARAQVYGIRRVTGDATLAADDRAVIIDAAGGTPIEITLDAGSSSRVPVEIIWIGDDTTLRTLNIVRNGGTGTIDTVSDDKVFSMLSGHAMHVRLTCTGVGEWWTDASGQFGDVQFVTSPTATILRPLVYVTYAGAVTLDAPPVGAMPRVGVFRAGLPYAIDINRVGSDTINGATSLSIPTAYAGAELVALSAGVWGAGLTLSPTSVHARLDALEVPSALVCDGAGSVHTKSWTTEAEADVTDAVAAYTIGLDGNTTQWPIGVSRPVNKLNTSAFGITLDPQPTHTINGVAAGTNVLLMNSGAVPSGTVAAGIWRVKRLSATAWWVQ